MAETRRVIATSSRLLVVDMAAPAFVPMAGPPREAAERFIERHGLEPADWPAREEIDGAMIRGRRLTDRELAEVGRHSPTYAEILRDRDARYVPIHDELGSLDGG